MSQNEHLTPVAKSIDVVHRTDLLGGSAGGPAGASPFALTPGALLRALRRRVKLALAIGTALAAVAVACVWVYLPPPKPRVSVKLLVDYSQHATLFEHPDSPLSQQTQINVLRSEAVITAALRNPEISQLDLVRQHPDPVEWLEKELVVDYPLGPEIIRITLVTMQTDDGIKLVDAIKTAYLNDFANKSTSGRRERLEKLQALQATTLESLKRKQAAVRRDAELVGTTDPKTMALQQQLIQEQFSTAQREYLKLQSDIRRQQLEEKALQAGGVVPQTPAESVIQQYVTSDPVVLSLSKREAQLEGNLRAAEQQLVGAAREAAIGKARHDLETVTKDAAEAKAKARKDYLAAVAVQTEQAGKTRQAQLKEQLAFQQELSRVLLDEVERLGKSMKTVNNANLNLETARIEISTAEGLYARVAAAIATHLAEQLAPSRVSPLENARVERVNIDARKLQFAGVAAAAAFGLVFLLVALLEFRNQRIDSPELAVKAAELPLLGTVPWFPTGLQRWGDSRREYWHSLLNESMASTQMFLRNAGAVGLPRIILVTSAEKGEGKTLLSTHLAAGFARNGVKVLLIDGDLRRPSAHTSFGADVGPGLSDLLRGEATDADVIREVRANLFLLPAGKCDEAAITALARGVAAADFRRFLSDYEIVVIDSSPLLLVADALHYAKRADGVLIAVRNGYSRATMVRETTRRLRQVVAPLLGIIVNGYSHGGYGYGYRQGYNRLPASKNAKSANTVEVVAVKAGAQ